MSEWDEFDVENRFGREWSEDEYDEIFGDITIVLILRAIERLFLITTAKSLIIKNTVRLFI